MNNAEAIKHAVAAGLGLSVLSRLSVVNEVKRGELRILKISDLRFLRKFSIIYHKNKFITDHIRDFIETTVSLLPPFQSRNTTLVDK
jgi:DNA-binding transcriptional LysR family regulator